MIRVLRLACLLTALAGAAQAAEPIVGGVSLGGGSRVTRVDNVWIAGSLKKMALTQAKAKGVRTIIDLREPSEPGQNEASMAAGLQMSYRNIPIPKAAPVSPEAFQQIDGLVLSQPNEKIIVHCASGNRASAWLAVHLVEKRGLGLEKAIRIARQAGLSREAEAQVRSHLQPPTPDEAPTPEPTQEEDSDEEEIIEIWR